MIFTKLSDILEYIDDEINILNSIKIFGIKNNAIT